MSIKQIDLEDLQAHLLIVQDLLDLLGDSLGELLAVRSDKPKDTLGANVLAEQTIGLGLEHGSR